MSSNLRVDGARLLSRLMALAAIGATPEGGCRRLALTDEDRQGRDWLVTEMTALGLEVKIDAIGNVVGILKGREPGPAVILGSHIDTVGTGGRYDGALGVVAGVEVLATLRDAGLVPKRDLAVIAFTNEEGARFHPDMLGSYVWAGGMSVEAAHAEQDADGAVLGTELRRIGYAGRERPGFLPAHAYLELHIEQGPVLENEGGGLGAVTGIQAICWLELTLKGRPSHAGTTPMAYRKDPGLAAARINVYANDLTRAIPGQLANSGVIRVQPANVNVVPETVLMTLDLRNPDDAALARAEAAVRGYCAEIAARHGIEISFRDLARFPATPFTETLIATVEQSAADLGLPIRRIISGAGHDAQMMSRLCPTAMVFIPSIGGLSHNPAEFSTPEDIASGANVLLNAAWRVANA
ncbi:MAG: Zn-dependent hydrolase [Bosea sp. (in: a-proteobacteria)]|uniref:Zn-dependent hydrolase n=1 Tax=Bosea sp. (in: a-proteobacteria) TaxID=1871050 RepID=UPI002732E8B0|nr:Zn-dependent hydrolase [Bosea sp. (in: a-proteobacteria)]MDP3255986.1 Zn-dependent hydrolase [Bosea sp. (in: a-proteobacteria)]MDP3318144.1 Zn-dependent hydrolase [Bosea sp. (in: a-proteobacteria)]